jgi:hypothetical protein
LSVIGLQADVEAEAPGFPLCDPKADIERRSSQASVALRAAPSVDGRTAAVFGSRALVLTSGRMDDLTYWTEKLRQAEQELDAARTRTALDEAASRYQRAKAELRALEKSAKAAQRRTRSAEPSSCSQRAAAGAPCVAPRGGAE